MKKVTIILGVTGVLFILVGILGFGDEVFEYIFGIENVFANNMMQTFGGMTLVAMYFYIVKNPVAFFLARIIDLFLIGFIVFTLTGKAAAFNFDLGFFVGVLIWFLAAVFYPMISKTKEEFNG